MARRKKRADGLLQKSFRIKIKGVSKQFVVYGHNERELSEKEKAKREEIESGIRIQNDPTVEEYYRRWVRGRKETVSSNTLRSQDQLFGVVIKIKMADLSNIYFGDMKIRSVTIEDLRFVQNTLKNGRKTQTVNDYMAFIKHLFSDAQKERVIDYNPCVLLKNLKRVEERARDTHHRALTLDEQKAFFESERCKRSAYYSVYKFAILTGTRIGEIGALKYSDISDDMIHISRTITRSESGAYVVGNDGKTKSARRTIPLTAQIREIIQQQRELCTLLNGGVIPLDDFIFKAVEGGLLLSTPIDRELKRICKAANIRPINMHAFRATFATRAIENGMAPRTIMELLGHSNFNISMSLYGHCLDDTKIQEMNALVINI